MRPPTEQPMLGRGVYRMSEIAKYAQLPTQRVRSWFTTKPYGMRGGPLFFSDYSIVDNQYAGSFLDLIDVFVAGRLRESGVSMSRIRLVYEKLEEELDTVHPFAHSKFYTDGKAVITLAADGLGDEQLRDVLAEQYLFLESTSFLHSIDYDAKSDLATRWRIAHGVQIDPALSFGKPVVAGTGVSTYVLANQFEANGRDAGLVADLFSVTEKDVMNAVDFEAEYEGAEAA